MVTPYIHPNYSPLLLHKQYMIKELHCTHHLVILGIAFVCSNVQCLHFHLQYNGCGLSEYYCCCTISCYEPAILGSLCKCVSITTLQILLVKEGLVSIASYLFEHVLV